MNKNNYDITEDEADPLATGSALGWDGAGWLRSTPGIDESCMDEDVHLIFENFNKKHANIFVYFQVL